MDPAERLDAVERLFEDLRHANEDAPLIVEGAKDEAALRNLGFAGSVVRVNSGQTVIALVESLSEDHAEIIILTDWDHHGGRLARRIRESCDACGIRWDDHFRRDLARLVKKEVKDVEGLDTYLRNLRIKVRGFPGPGRRSG